MKGKQQKRKSSRSLKEKQTGKSPQRITQLGEFRLGPRLGRGAMGTIYRARHLTTDREVAIKVLRRHLSTNPMFVKRFKREAALMAALSHPNIVRCYGAGKQSGRYYFAMELVEGYSARDWKNRLGKLCIGDALHILLVCARALEHAHSKNMIHRDIKPDNILISRTGDIKLADLGLARAFDTEDVTVTKVGRGAGTPVYVAPEQARDASRAEPRSDIHALGCTFYHLITGELPFKGENSLEVVLNKIDCNYVPAGELCPDVSPKVENLIAKMLAPHLDDRFANCTELIQEIESLSMAHNELSFIKEIDPLSLEGSVVDTDEQYHLRTDCAGDTGHETRSGKWYVVFRSEEQTWIKDEMTLVELEKNLHTEDFRLSAQVGRREGEYRSLQSFPETRALLRRIERMADQEEAGSFFLSHLQAIRDGERAEAIRCFFKRLFTTTEGWLWIILGLTSLIGMVTLLYWLTRLF